MRNIILFSKYSEVPPKGSGARRVVRAKGLKIRQVMDCPGPGPHWWSTRGGRGDKSPTARVEGKNNRVDVEKEEVRHS